MNPQPAAMLLNAAELDRLAQFEGVIRQGRETFIEVGLALNSIREERLYRAGYGTFEEYCRGRWEFGARQAYRICAAAEAVAHWVRAAPANGGTATPGSVRAAPADLPLPDTEKQVRPLLRLPEAQQMAVWSEAVKLSPNGRPTARQLAEMVNARLGVPQGTGNGRHLGRQIARSQLPLTGVLHLSPADSLPRQSPDLETLADLEQVTALLRRVIDREGTPDSEAANLVPAMDRVENFKAQKARTAKLQENRPSR